MPGAMLPNPMQSNRYAASLHTLKLPERIDCDQHYAVPLDDENYQRTGKPSSVPHHPIPYFWLRSCCTASVLLASLISSLHGVYHPDAPCTTLSCYPGVHPQRHISSNDYSIKVNDSSI
jgi:hypothetical protein